LIGLTAAGASTTSVIARSLLALSVQCIATVAPVAAPRLAEFAEAPGLWLPDDGQRELIALDGLTVALYGDSWTVEGIRLRSGAVDRTVREVRELARARRRREVSWWLSGRSKPGDLEQELLARGLVPDESEQELTTLTIDRPPNGEPEVEVRRVQSFDDYLRAVEIDWEVFDVPRSQRAARRAAAPDVWRRQMELGNVVYHLARVGGEPAGFARTVLTPAGGLMLGGATLRRARGRGVYTSLVHARWAEVAARGAPGLGTAAGSMSGPILRKLGFTEHGRVRLLVDRL
jgi:hypothetical protein